jgi:hypothetical protein
MTLAHRTLALGDDGGEVRLHSDLVAGHTILTGST